MLNMYFRHIFIVHERGERCDAWGIPSVYWSCYCYFTYPWAQYETL